MTGVMKPCMEWTGTIHRATGYGVLYFERRHWYAHRLMWTLTHGPIPRPLYVLHRCDNRRCVEPEHLFLGTHLDNIADMVAKGRHARGKQMSHAKLTDDQVRELRRLHREGMGAIRLGRLFNLSTENARRAALGRRYAHVR